MPASVANTPTFNRSVLPGWYSRLIYTHVYLDEGYTTVGGNYFTEINPDGAKGTYQFPAGYWQRAEGRILRIQGSFLYSGDASRLNFVVRIVDSGGFTSGVESDTNHGNIHDFAAGTAREDVPVFFEIELSHGPTEYFNITGYYQYEYENYNGTGPNINVVHVPIYIDNSVDSIDSTNNPTTLVLIIQNQAIKPIYLTIEELG